MSLVAGLSGEVCSSLLSLLFGQDRQRYHRLFCSRSQYLAAALSHFVECSEMYEGEDPLNMKYKVLGRVSDKMDY